MTGAVALLAVTALLTVCGLGVLAAVGVAASPAALVRRSGIAPLAGTAWAGIIAATLATAGTSFGLVGLVALTAVTCAAGSVRLAVRAAASDRRPRRHLSGLELALLTGAVVIVGLVGTAGVAAFHDKPLAEYDGWAIWGTKARAIAHLGHADEEVFTGEAYERLHLEYPLLLPALHALHLGAADDYSSNSIIVLCLVVGAAGLLAIWSLYRDRIRPPLLLAFLAAIVAMPAFLVQLGTGYADVPLAVLVAAGLAAGARWLVDDGSEWLALATLFFAAAALTKNEGLLFAGSAYVPLLVASGRRRAVALSALLVALAYAPWRAFIEVNDLDAPDYDLSSSFDLPWVAGRLDRAPVAAGELLEQALQPRQFGLLLVLGIAAAVLALGYGPRRLGLLALGFAVLSLAGLTWIYVLTPYDLPFYLSTNSNRVVMSLVVGLAALSPLLVEESARTLSAGEGDVGPHR